MSKIGRINRQHLFALGRTNSLAMMVKEVFLIGEMKKGYGQGEENVACKANNRYYDIPEGNVCSEIK